MSSRRRVPWAQRLRAAASVITTGAVAGRYGPLVNASQWNRDLSDASADLYVDEQTSMTVSTVWACVSLLSDSVSQLPIQVFQREGDRRRALSDHPLSKLFRGDVNDSMSRRSFVKALELARQTAGAGFAQVERDASGVAVGLWPLRTATPKRNQAGRFYYDVAAGGERYELAPRDVIHIKGIAPDGVNGLSPIGSARRTIALTLAMEKFGADFFKNEAKSGGFFLHPGKLSQKAKDNIVDSIMGEDSDLATRRQGSWRAKVLEEGMKWISTTIAPNEGQFNESRELQITEIARVFRVPLILIGAHERNTSWGSGIESLLTGFAKFTLAPLAMSWEDELSSKLLTEKEQDDGIYIRLNMDALLRGDSTSRAAFYASGIQNQWLTPNEARAREELDPLEGGDVAVDRPPPASPGDRP